MRDNFDIIPAVTVKLENCEHRKYFCNVIVSSGRSQSDVSLLNCKQLFACVLISNVIGHNTINIPKIFQVFTVHNFTGNSFKFSVLVFT